MHEKQSIYRTSFSLAFGICIFLLCVFTLEKTGVPRGYSIALTGASLFAIFAISIFSGGTTSAFKYFFSGKSTRSTVNALAMTGVLAFPVLIGSGGGLVFSNPTLVIAIIVGTTIGAAFSSLLISRSFHESGASDIGDLLNKRFSTALVAKCVATTLLVSAIGLGVIGMYFASMLASWFFMVSQHVALLAIVCVTLLAALLGGSNSGTKLACVATVILLIGLNLPLIVQSLSLNGFPVGQITFGVGALADIWDLEDQLKSLGIPLLGSVVTSHSPLNQWSSGELVAAGVVVAAAVSFFPALTHQYALSPSTETASRSATKLILFVSFTGLSLLALLIFSKYSLYQIALGLSLSEARLAAPFLYSWSDRSADLVVICDKVLTNEAALLTACSDGAEHILGIQDLKLNGNLLLAAAPDIAALPFAFTALLTSGIILSLISFSAMILLSSANILSSAFFSNVTARVASAKIFISRILTIAIGLMVGGFVLTFQLDPLAIFMFCMSITATVCAPSLIGALWLKQSGPTAVLASISLGLVVTILYYVLSKYGIDFIVGTNDELRIVLPGMSSIIPPELSAIYGLPIALLILFCSAFYADIINSNGTVVG